MDNPDDFKPVIKKGSWLSPDTFNNPKNWTDWRRPGLFEFVGMKCKEANEAGIPWDNKKEIEDELPVYSLDIEGEKKLNNPPENDIQIMWIGHATLLVQFDGINILTDPVFLDRCSPIQIAGPKRYRPVPCEIKDLPLIDAVVISHNHYDHLEHDAVKQLNYKFGDKTKWFVPMKMKDWFTKYGCSNVTEMTWWDDSKYVYGVNKTAKKSVDSDKKSEDSAKKSEDYDKESEDSAQFYCVPAQHWSQRGPGDAMTSLWCGWIVKGKKHTFYYTGDTGYCPVFKQIKKRLNLDKIDFSAIPIGCYAPRYFMKPQHINPDEAVQIHKDVDSKRSVGIHWGTFDGLGSHEHYLEPRKLLKEAREKYQLKEEEFFTIEHGKIKVISSNPDDISSKPDDISSKPDDISSNPDDISSDPDVKSSNWEVISSNPDETIKEPKL